MFGKESDENARIQQLATLDRFKDFTDDEVRMVLDASTYLTVPEGWAMMAENTPADKAYLILSGEVSVRRSGEEVARVGAGDLIGEMALVNHKLRSATVVTETPLEALHFTAESVASLNAKIPHFNEAITGASAERGQRDQGD
ncbi:cyclic nucleotide-binding domain-containing protein [Nocardioides marmoriginsengisoli]|uniref:Cyclic nucleotide-binding domain-containing protein n=1 Tax=Nocardioides marmoriginsengisoli TaxID=661483 RepID=A0A3N0CGG5_9ACTN|nr:cyclic nucleotide-binding domain-containing protein [Nocardioides marmoriginsengisoli]RNL62106.1 cyclic nucleotide-binding domain-containing protein [Nocardioides marmoriginsengisoli]